jgi:hypothetical protein
MKVVTDAQKKREEEEAQSLQQAKNQAEVLNQQEADKKAQQWSDGQAILNAYIVELEEKGATPEQIAALREQGANQGFGVAHQNASLLNQILIQQTINQSSSKPLYSLSNDDIPPGCDPSGNICQSYVDPEIDIDDYFSGARTLTRVAYLGLGLVAGTAIGLFVASKIPHPIGAGIAGLFTAGIVVLGINTIVSPYETEIISDIEEEFRKAQTSGQPLTIGYPPQNAPVLKIPLGGNYIVDGDGDGEGIYVNTPAANLTVQVFAYLFDVTMPSP